MESRKRKTYRMIPLALKSREHTELVKSITKNAFAVHFMLVKIMSRSGKTYTSNTLVDNAEEWSATIASLFWLHHCITSLVGSAPSPAWSPLCPIPFLEVASAVGIGGGGGRASACAKERPEVFGVKDIADWFTMTILVSKLS